MINLDQFLYVYVQNIWNFALKVWEILEKMKTDVDRLVLVFIMKTNVPIYFAKIELFFIFKTKK